MIPPQVNGATTPKKGLAPIILIALFPMIPPQVNGATKKSYHFRAMQGVPNDSAPS